MPALARTILLVAAAVFLAVQGPETWAADLPERLGSDPRLSKFHQLINQAGLTGWLRSRSGFTVFAPTNRAIAAAPPSVRVVLRPPSGAGPRTLRGRLQHLVRSHVFTIRLPPSALIGQRRTYTAADGAPRIVDGTEPGVIAIRTAPRTRGVKSSLRAAYVFGRTIAADNGIIYPIDRVLVD
jgi:uncharacterized surface protein with fasciclin (FAS1) repeats